MSSEKYFIGITEGGIGSLDVDSPSDIGGFFTTDQQTCFTLYAFGIGDMKGKLTLCHTNGQRDDSIIPKMFKWVTRTNSKRYILITDESYEESKTRETFSTKTLSFLKNKDFKYKVYHTAIVPGFNEANFKVDREGNISKICKYDLPPNPYQNPRTYLYRFMYSMMTKMFVPDKKGSIDIQFNHDSIVEIKPMPREWTDIINDSCRIEDSKLIINSNKINNSYQNYSKKPNNEKFNYIMLNVIHMWFTNLKYFYANIKHIDIDRDLLFEAFPKLGIAIKYDFEIVNEGERECRI